MKNKKRISKLLKKKYKPSKGRLVKYFNDFQFGIDFGANISELKKALIKVAEVTTKFKVVDFHRPFPINLIPHFNRNNPFLVYPDQREPTLLELKSRVDELTYVVRNTPIDTEKWRENIFRLKKARIDFESMREKKEKEFLKPGIAEMMERLTDNFVTNLSKYRPEIFEYSFEKEYLSRPLPRKPLVEMLENSLLKTKQYRDFRYPRNIFKEGITTFEKKGETMSGDIIYTCKLTEDGFRYEIDFINKIDYTEIIGERRILLPKYKEFW